MYLHRCIKGRLNTFDFSQSSGSFSLHLFYFIDTIWNYIRLSSKYKTCKAVCGLRCSDYVSAIMCLISLLSRNWTSPTKVKRTCSVSGVGFRGVIAACFPTTQHAKCTWNIHINITYNFLLWYWDPMCTVNNLEVQISNLSPLILMETQKGENT